MSLEYVICICLVCLIHAFYCKKFVLCPMKNEVETRQLYVATCDTRSGWREFHALKVWNLTGDSLRKQGLYMVNVCKGENWGKHGFLTKPLLYVEFLKRLLANSNAHRAHAILMDSDTFWSVNSIQDIWRNYDCARGNKTLVVSTEMSCWVGRYCTQADIDRWYSNPQASDSFSPFANSGVVMGQIHDIVRMLEYVIVNNRSYYTTYGKKYKFDDQYAIADYAINIAPYTTALDYHQLISASCSIHAPGDPPDEGWPFLCKNRNGTFSFSCHIYNSLLRRQGHFVLDKFNCLVHRKVWEGMPLKFELETLAMSPLIWHGNGKHIRYL